MSTKIVCLVALAMSSLATVASAQTVTVVAQREVVYVRDTVVITTTQPPAGNTAGNTAHNSASRGGTCGQNLPLRYVKGTSREAGRQDFCWNQ